MSLGGQEVSLAAVLGAAVLSLEPVERVAGRPLPDRVDVIAGNLESFGVISAADGAALRADVPLILALYWDSCWAFAE